MPVTFTTPPMREWRTAVPSEPIWRLGVEQYHAMIAADILTEDDAVELLEGWLVTKMPKKPSHRAATMLTREGLSERIPDGWYVDAQEPITTANSEPEPDVVVVRGNTRQYLDRHPGPDDVGIVVEVSDATLGRDQNSKKRIYAEAGIPVYWIVNLQKERIEVYTEPSGPTEEPNYASQKNYKLGEQVPVILDEESLGAIDVRDLLP